MNAIRAEVRKLTTVRMPWWCLTVGVLFAAALAVGAAYVAKLGAPVALPHVAVASGALPWLFILIVGAGAATQEFRDKTIRTTLLAVPDRRAVVLSKSAVVAGYGVLMTTLAMAVSAIAGVITSRLIHVSAPMGSVGDWLTAIAGSVLGAVFVAVLACTVGMLARNIAMAIIGLLLWWWVAEPLLPRLLHSPGLADWLPSGLLDSSMGGDGGLGVAPAVAMLAGYLAVLLGLAVLQLRRVDCR